MRDLVNWSGQVGDHIDYTGYGVPTESNPSVGSIIGYDGYLTAATSGLHFSENRVYNPSTGTWLTQDPMTFASGQANLYQYVGNEPTDFTYATGLARASEKNQWTFSSNGKIAIWTKGDEIYVWDPNSKKLKYKRGKGSWIIIGRPGQRRPGWWTPVDRKNSKGWHSNKSIFGETVYSPPQDWKPPFVSGAGGKTVKGGKQPEDYTPPKDLHPFKPYTPGDLPSSPLPPLMGPPKPGDDGDFHFDATPNPDDKSDDWDFYLGETGDSRTGKSGVGKVIGGNMVYFSIDDLKKIYKTLHEILKPPRQEPPPSESAELKYRTRGVG